MMGSGPRLDRPVFAPLCSTRPSLGEKVTSPKRPCVEELGTSFWVQYLIPGGRFPRGNPGHPHRNTFRVPLRKHKATALPRRETWNKLPMTHPSAIAAMVEGACPSNRLFTNKKLGRFRSVSLMRSISCRPAFRASSSFCCKWSYGSNVFTAPA